MTDITDINSYMTDLGKRARAASRILAAANTGMKDKALNAIADDLDARGYLVEEREGENSGIHTVLVTGDTLTGAADSRREGIVGRVPGKAGSD